MEPENADQALFNASTEFLISIDSALDSKVGMPVWRDDSSVGTGLKVAADDTDFADGHPVNAADSEQIVCEFSDVDSGWFTSSNAGAGESANNEDMFLSLMSCVKPDDQPDNQESAAAEGTHEDFLDRKLDYIQHNADISSHFSANADDMAKAANVISVELTDSNCRTPAEQDENQAVYPTALVSDQPFTSQQNFTKHDTDKFSDFSNMVTENSIEAQSQKRGPDETQFHDGNKNQSVQFSELFPNNDEFCQRLIDNEDISPVFCTVAVFDQQLLMANNEPSLEKHSINTVWPDVRSSPIEQELSSELRNQMFSEEVMPAEKSDLLISQKDVLDTCDVTVNVDEIEIHAVPTCAVDNDANEFDFDIQNVIPAQSSLDADKPKIDTACTVDLVQPAVLREPSNKDSLAAAAAEWDLVVTLEPEVSIKTAMAQVDDIISSISTISQ